MKCQVLFSLKNNNNNNDNRMSQHTTKPTIRLVQPAQSDQSFLIAYVFYRLWAIQRDKQESLPYWVDVQADLSLYWSHRSYCRLCCVLAWMLSATILLSTLTLILLSNLISHTHFWISTNQITSYNVFIQIHKLTDKQCRSWSDGFFRSHLIWSYTVCKSRGCHEQQDKG